MRKKSAIDYESEAVQTPAPYGLSKPCAIHPTVRDGTARKVYELRHGKISSSKVLVCHKCDRYQCVEDSHHFLGSQKDNMQDASRKGRIVHTEAQKAALTSNNKARTGWKQSELSKSRIKAAMTGEGNPQFGKTGALGACYGRKGELHPMYGRSHSEESKRKISEASKKSHARRSAK